MEGSAAVDTGKRQREEIEDVVVRFAGDSGDGVQITGGQFTLTTALAARFAPRATSPTCWLRSTRLR